MLIIPAIDIREGKCVRLVQGKVEEETIYSEDPVEIAASWQEKGAPMLHLVDLDGAFTGKTENISIVKRIREEVSTPLQLGGGIRSLETIDEILSAGINRVVLGTAAVSNPKLVSEACAYYKDKVVVGVDNKGGNVAIEGWGTAVDKEVLEFTKELEDMGVKRVIYTDTQRDGTLRGIDMDSVKRYLESTSLKVIISGGIASTDNLKGLLQLNLGNLEGVILGKSLYSQKINIEEALKMAGNEYAG